MPLQSDKIFLKYATTSKREVLKGRRAILCKLFNPMQVMFYGHFDFSWSFSSCPTISISYLLVFEQDHLDLVALEMFFWNHIGKLEELFLYIFPVTSTF